MTVEYEEFLQEEPYKRNNGFYRIRMRSMLFPDGWQIAYWFQNRWFLVMSDENYYDENFEEIDENQIDVL